MGTRRLRLKSAWKNASEKNSPLGKSASGKSRGGGSLQMFSRSDFPDGSKVSIPMLTLLVNIASIGIIVTGAGVVVVPHLVECLP